MALNGSDGNMFRSGLKREHFEFHVAETSSAGDEFGFDYDDAWKEVRCEAVYAPPLAAVGSQPLLRYRCTFSAVPDLWIPNSELITVIIKRTAFMYPIGAAEVTLGTITVIDQASHINTLRTTTVDVVSGASVGVSTVIMIGASMGGTAVVQGFAMAALLHSPCASDADRMGSTIAYAFISWFSSIGPLYEVLGNLLVVVAVMAVQYGMVVYLTLLSANRLTHRDSLAMAHCPSFTFGVIQWLYVSSCAATFTLFATASPRGTARTEMAVAAGSLLLLCLVPVVAWYLCKRIAGTLRFKRYPDTLDFRNYHCCTCCVDAVVIDVALTDQIEPPTETSLDRFPIGAWMPRVDRRAFGSLFNHFGKLSQLHSVYPVCGSWVFLLVFSALLYLHLIPCRVGLFLAFVWASAWAALVVLSKPFRVPIFNRTDAALLLLVALVVLCVALQATLGRPSSAVAWAKFALELIFYWLLLVRTAYGGYLQWMEYFHWTRLFVDTELVTPSINIHDASFHNEFGAYDTEAIELQVMAAKDDQPHVPLLGDDRSPSQTLPESPAVVRGESGVLVAPQRAHWFSGAKASAQLDELLGQPVLMRRLAGVDRSRAKLGTSFLQPQQEALRSSLASHITVLETFDEKLFVFDPLSVDPPRLVVPPTQPVDPPRLEALPTQECIVNVSSMFLVPSQATNYVVNSVHSESICAVERIDVFITEEAQDIQVTDESSAGFGIADHIPQRVSVPIQGTSCKTQRAHRQFFFDPHGGETTSANDVTHHRPYQYISVDRRLQEVMRSDLHVSSKAPEVLPVNERPTDIVASLDSVFDDIEQGCQQDTSRRPFNSLKARDSGKVTFSHEVKVTDGGAKPKRTPRASLDDLL